MIPAALIAALIVNDTFADGKDLVLDARAAGVAAAAVAAWRRAPLIVVIVLGAAVTATVRQLSCDSGGRDSDQTIERAQVAPPDHAQHRLPTDQPGDRPAEVPREPQVLRPREPGATIRGRSARA